MPISVCAHVHLHVDITKPTGKMKVTVTAQWNDLIPPLLLSALLLAPLPESDLLNSHGDTSG